MCTYRGCEHVLEARNKTGLCGACRFHVRKAESEVLRLWNFYREEYIELGNRSPVRNALVREFVMRAAKILENRYTGTFVGKPTQIADYTWPLSETLIRSVWTDAQASGKIVLVNTSPNEWIINGD
jgi:hypothetical protein